MTPPTACPGFALAHAGDPVAVAAHELAHALFCDSGVQIKYRDLLPLLAADVATGAPVPDREEIDVIAGCFEETDPRVERANRTYPRTVARIEAEF